MTLSHHPSDESSNENPNEALADRSVLPQSGVQDYPQSVWNNEIESAARTLVKLALDEDLRDQRDWSSFCSIDPNAKGNANLGARSPGVVCGLNVIPIVLEEIQKRTGAEIEFHPKASDGASVSPGDILGSFQGTATGILTAERTFLNFIGRMSGIATLTSRFAKEIEGSGCRLYDTRKTTPGWRLLEKYSVKMGGGHNHRMGLHAAVMLKDNHLAESTEMDSSGNRPTFASVIRSSQRRLLEARGADSSPLIFEVEVDSLEQFREILPLDVDIILLDNMTNDQLREAVRIRNESGSMVQLEASGNVKLTTIAQIAHTGVDRISSGALTHSATNWDVGLDWQ